MLIVNSAKNKVLFCNSMALKLLETWELDSIDLKAPMFKHSAEHP